MFRRRKIGIIGKIKLIAIGVNLFHAISIIRSYRYRGVTLRVNSRINTISGVVFWEFVRRALESSLMKRRFKYSLMISEANFIPEYSTLNPDTSSDSPSVKSKGIRLTSAKTITSHIRVIGVASVHLEVRWPSLERAVMSKVPAINLKKIRIKINGIS